MSQKSKLLIVLGLGVALVIFVNRYNHNIKSGIMANKYETIAKTYKLENKLKKTWLYYKYKFKDSIYISKITTSEFNPSSFLNRYYRVDVNSKDPKRDILYLDKEVTDSLEIAKLGF